MDGALNQNKRTLSFHGRAQSPQHLSCKLKVLQVSLGSYHMLQVICSKNFLKCKNDQIVETKIFNKA